MLHNGFGREIMQWKLKVFSFRNLTSLTFLFL